jgi:hypothetical protein
LRAADANELVAVPGSTQRRRSIPDDLKICSEVRPNFAANSSLVTTRSGTNEPEPVMNAFKEIDLYVFRDTVQSTLLSESSKHSHLHPEPFPCILIHSTAKKCVQC